MKALEEKWKDLKHFCQEIAKMEDLHQSPTFQDFLWASTIFSCVYGDVFSYIISLNSHDWFSAAGRFPFRSQLHSRQMEVRIKASHM